MKSKPQLHQSSIETLLRCGEQYRRIYVMGQRVPPDVARIRGQSVHKSAEANLTYKIDHKGRLLTVSHVKDIARDAFIKIWKEDPVKLSPEEAVLGLKKVRGLGIDTSVKLAALHHKVLAPIIFPIKGGIERKWVIQCPGYPFDLAGRLDVQEEPESYGMTYVRLRDLKTKGKSPTQPEVDNSIQFTLYDMAIQVNDKKKVDEIWLDALVNTKTPKCISLKSKRSVEDYKAFRALFERCCDVITKGVFTPTSPTRWECSPRWCGFYNGDPERGIDPCPFVRGKLLVPTLTGAEGATTQKGDADGKARKGSGANRRKGPARKRGNLKKPARRRQHKVSVSRGSRK